MEGEGIIEDHEGPAPWISHLVLAPKDDGGLRVTVDMRESKRAIQDTGLPIPRAEDIRKEFAGCKYFTKLDLRSAFYQLELEEQSRYLTVFPHHGKLKQHTSHHGRKTSIRGAQQSPQTTLQQAPSSACNT